MHQRKGTARGEVDGGFWLWNDGGGGGAGGGDGVKGGPRRAVRHGEDESLLTALGKFSQEGHFWLISVSIMLITPLTEMNSWWPSYLSHVLKLSPGEAASIASVFPAGFIISVLLGGWLYDRLSSRGRFVFISSLLLTGTCVALALRFVHPTVLLEQLELAVESPDASVSRDGDGMVIVDPAHPHYAKLVALRLPLLVLVFLLGFCFGPAYFIPTSVYCASFGGKRHCSTLAGLLDAFGYLSTTAFMVAVGHIAKANRWVQVLDLLWTSLACCTLTYSLFMCRNVQLKYC
mmetsp:Transcript_35813/g.102998  ORF Transcript_35813/g.102998 Transcript_35813/m.102998 type:complete len:290 (-) Transcript_35813:408-1277(-)